MKKFFVLIPVFVLIILLFFVFKAKNKKSESEFLAAEVTRGDITIMVSATGTLEAVTTVQVGSQVSGTISALYVDFNSQVKKGQLIAQLDPTFLKAQVAQAQADFESAKASTDLSRKEYERSLSLFEKNMISESEKDNSLTKYELAKAQEKSAQASLDRVKTNLDYATITSPIDGVVISRDVDVGQTVAASLQAPTLFTIAKDLTKMKVNASIDEADIGKIKEGQEVSFTVDAYPEQNFKGKVSQIRLSPEVVQNVVSYDVIIEVSNPELLLKPGMTANVTVLVDQRINILKVPAGALRFRPSLEKEKNGSSSKSNEGINIARNLPPSGDMSPDKINPSGLRKAGQTALWILNQQGKPEPVPVQTGISDGTFTEVISDNLKEGDKVITSQKNSVQSINNQQVNPFAPRFGGGRR
ncbi:MAG TPA: efflux RND transporter periplasmic adaptor subunit [candidate division Zixibacteria bacterium]